MNNQNKRQKFIELMSDIECKLQNSEIIEQLGISYETFNRWLESKKLKQEIKNRIDSQIDSYLQRIWGAVIEKAIGGDLQSAKIILEYRSKAEQNTSFADNLNISVKVES